MLKKLMLAAAALMMLAACNGSKTTHLSGDFGDKAPDRVKVIVGDNFDTVVAVKDGKFEVDVPVNFTTLSRARVGMSVYSFISDGSKITLDPEAGKACSNKKNGPHTHYIEYVKWMDDFLADYHKKLDEIGDDKQAADDLFNGMKTQYDEYQKATIKANKGNILGLMAFRQIDNGDPKEMLPLLNTLSSKMQQLPEVANKKKEYEEMLK